MNAEKVLTSINEIAKMYAPEIAKTKEFMALAQSLHEEIMLAEQKKAGKGDRYKAALRFSKALNKEFSESRPGISGAFIGEDGAQYMIHQHYGVRYETPFDGLIESDKNVAAPSVKKMFDRYESTKKVDLPTLAELKTQLKLEKAYGNKFHGMYLTNLNGIYYQTQYLIQLMEMVEPTEAYFASDSKFPSLMIIGDGAKGICCAVNTKKGEDE